MSILNKCGTTRLVTGSLVSAYFYQIVANVVIFGFVTSILLGFIIFIAMQRK